MSYNDHDSSPSSEIVFLTALLLAAPFSSARDSKMNDALAIKLGIYPIEKQVEPVVIRFPKFYIALVLVICVVFTAVLVAYALVEQNVFSWCILIAFTCLFWCYYVPTALAYEIRADEKEIQQRTSLCNRSSIPTDSVRAVYVEHFEHKGHRQHVDAQCVNIMLLHNDGTTFSIAQREDMLEPFVAFLHAKFPNRIEAGYIPSQFYQSKFAQLAQEYPYAISLQDLLAKP